MVVTAYSFYYYMFCIVVIIYFIFIYISRTNMELSKRASLPERDVSSKELALDIAQYPGREGSDRRAKESDSGAQDTGPFEKATAQERGDEDLARGKARPRRVEAKTGNPIAHQSAASDNEASNNYELDQAVTDINAQAKNTEGVRAATQSADQP